MSNRDLQKSTTMREGIVAAIKRERAAMSRQETLDYCIDTDRHNGNARLLADLGLPTRRSGIGRTHPTDSRTDLPQGRATTPPAA